MSDQVCGTKIIPAQEYDDLVNQIGTLRAQLSATHNSFAWISITDRYPSPEKDTPYAVFAEGRVYVEDWEVDYQQFEQMHSSITHWMELPKAPE